MIQGRTYSILEQIQINKKIKDVLTHPLVVSVFLCVRVTVAQET